MILAGVKLKKNTSCRHTRPWPIFISHFVYLMNFLCLLIYKTVTLFKTPHGLFAFSFFILFCFALCSLALCLVILDFLTLYKVQMIFPQYFFYIVEM